MTYQDLLLPRRAEADTPKRDRFLARHACSCVQGSVNTTELLLRNPKAVQRQSASAGPLGSHYFPNSDSLCGGVRLRRAARGRLRPDDHVRTALSTVQPRVDTVIPWTSLREGAGRRQRLLRAWRSAVRTREWSACSHTTLLWTGVLDHGTAVGSLVLTGLTGDGEVKAGDVLDSASTPSSRRDRR